MKLISFYLGHTFKNIIKRLFRSKSGIIALLMMVSMTCLLIHNMFNGKQSNSESLTEFELFQEITRNTNYMVIGVSLFIIADFIIHMITGVKKGSQIFQMPDVNFLFAAPIKAQTLLLFRIFLSMGANLSGSLFVFYQIPNLQKNFHFGLLAIIGAFLTYFLISVVGTLISILVYCICSTHSLIKQYLRQVCAGILGIIAIVFFISIQFMGNSFYDIGANLFLNRWYTKLPLFGWHSGFFIAFIEENVRNIVLYSILLVLEILALIFIIYKIKSDFYEDAMIGANVMQERINSAKEGTTVNKERSELFQRKSIIKKGFGTNVLMYKAVGNNRRFSVLGIFNGTSTLYYLVAIGIAIFLKIILHKDTVMPIYISLFILTYLCTYGAVIEEEIKLNFIFLFPESAKRKVFYCAMGDLTKFVQNTLPAYIISMVIMKENKLLAISVYFLLVMFYFLSCQCSVLIQLSFSSTVEDAIKELFCFFLKWIAAAPTLIIVLVFSVIGKLQLGMWIAIVLSLVIASLCMIATACLMERGRK